MSVHQLLSSAVGSARAAVLLWQRGVWDALQLQRCVVYFVLDDSGQVLAQTVRCITTNGVIYLGSLLLFGRAVQPALDWLLLQHAAPVYGAAAVAAWRQVLSAVFQLLWLLPVYLVSLLVSCIWYQQIAKATFEVLHKQQQQQQQQGQPTTEGAHSQAAGPTAAQQQQQQQQQQSRGTGWPPPAAEAGSRAGMLRVLEGTAQEVYRALLFVVFTVEVYILSLVPYAGPVLNVVLLSWLYAYYCFDYKWALEGIGLPARLQFFECNWAYFAGFGFPCVAATVFWPFHEGAALANLLFPLFIMAACAARPLEARRSVLQRAADEAAPIGSLPVFKLALRPTYWLVRRTCARFTKPTAAQAPGAN